MKKYRLVTDNNINFFINIGDVNSCIIRMQKHLFDSNSFEGHIIYYNKKLQEAGLVSLCYLVKTNQEIREYAENYMQENPELFL